MGALNRTPRPGGNRETGQDGAGNVVFANFRRGKRLPPYATAIPRNLSHAKSRTIATVDDLVSVVLLDLAKAA